MTSKMSTKRALLMSALSLLLCVSMLVSTTFAWFTDEVKSGNNILATGNLDVKLTHSNRDTSDRDMESEEVSENVKLFTDVAADNWEPGAVAYEKLTVTNAGTLALKYDLAINVAAANSVKFEGDSYTLADALQVAFVDASKLNGTREAAIAAGDEAGWASLSSIVKSGTLLEKDDSYTYGVVIYWEPTENDNIWNLRNGKQAEDGAEKLSIELGVHLTATQLMKEKDSYGEDYDEDAEYIKYDHVVTSLDELKQAFAEGGNILLTEDITFDNMIKIENNAEVYLNLNGNTIEFERNSAFVPGNPLFYPLPGTKLTITGNGTVDLGDNFDAALIYPAGEVVIENGTFIRNRVPDGTNPDNVQTLFMGVKSVGASIVIKDGYFDGGYYDKNADLTFAETDADIANRGKAADKNAYRMAIKNNTSLLINLSWSSAAGTQDFRIYGGTFVGANPAWGDEGCAMPITPNYLRPWSYYQGTFLEGQVMYDDKIELPAGYSIIEDTTADGRPVYTVNYSK